MIENYKSGRLIKISARFISIFLTLILLNKSVLKLLFPHYLKSLFRSTRLDANLVLKIMITFSLFYFCSLIFSLGANFTEILHKFQPLADPINFFNEFLFYLIPIDCLLRFFFQKNNFRLANAYMHLPIRKSKIISYILVIKLFNIFNLCLLLFIVPFSWVNILPDYGWFSFMLYLLSILFIMVFMTYFTFLIQNLSFNHILFALVPVLWVMLTLVLKFIYQMKPGTFTADLFADILQGNYLTVILFALLTALMTLVTISMIKQFFYNVFTDSGKNKFNIRIPKNSLLSKSSNSYILLEMNLLLRNRRIRNILIIPIYFILMTYFIFLFKPINDIYIILFWYLCLSGIWGYSYLQVVFTLESSFFDFISTTNFDFTKYFKTKYTLIVVISFMVILVALPIVITGNQNIHVVASALLYNIGIGYFLVFSTATFNRERMDLNNGLLFNYQGSNPIQVISMSFAIILPVAFLGIITFFLSQTAGLIIINIISVFSLLNYKKWFQMIFRQLSKRKYINLAGYRK